MGIRSLDLSSFYLNNRFSPVGVDPKFYTKIENVKDNKNVISSIYNQEISIDYSFDEVKKEVVLNTDKEIYFDVNKNDKDNNNIINTSNYNLIKLESKSKNNEYIVKSDVDLFCYYTPFDFFLLVDEEIKTSMFYDLFFFYITESGKKFFITNNKKKYNWGLDNPFEFPTLFHGVDLDFKSIDSEEFPIKKFFTNLDVRNKTLKKDFEVYQFNQVYNGVAELEEKKGKKFFLGLTSYEGGDTFISYFSGLKKEDFFDKGRNVVNTNLVTMNSVDDFGGGLSIPDKNTLIGSTDPRKAYFYSRSFDSVKTSLEKSDFLYKNYFSSGVTNKIDFYISLKNKYVESDVRKLLVHNGYVSLIPIKKITLNLTLNYRFEEFNNPKDSILNLKSLEEKVLFKDFLNSIIDGMYEKTYLEFSFVRRMYIIYGSQGGIKSRTQDSSKTSGIIGTNYDVISYHTHEEKKVSIYSIDYIFDEEKEIFGLFDSPQKVLDTEEESDLEFDCGSFFVKIKSRLLSSEGVDEGEDSNLKQVESVNSVYKRLKKEKLEDVGKKFFLLTRLESEMIKTSSIDDPTFSKQMFLRRLSYPYKKNSFVKGEFDSFGNVVKELKTEMEDNKLPNTKYTRTLILEDFKKNGVNTYKDITESKDYTPCVSRTIDKNADYFFRFFIPLWQGNINTYLNRKRITRDLNDYAFFDDEDLSLCLYVRYPEVHGGDIVKVREYDLNSLEDCRFVEEDFSKTDGTHGKDVKVFLEVDIDSRKHRISGVLSRPNFELPVFNKIISRLGYGIGYKDKNIYFSEPFNMFVFSPANMLPLDSNITNISETNLGVLVTTEDKTFHLVGNNASEFNLIEISSSIGGNKNTMSSVNGNPIWIFRGDLYTFSNSLVQSISRKLLREDFLENVINSFSLNTKYIGITTDSAYVFDSENLSVISHNYSIPDYEYKNSFLVKGGVFVELVEKKQNSLSNNKKIIKVFPDSSSGSKKEFTILTGNLNINYSSGAKVSKIFVFTDGKPVRAKIISEFGEVDLGILKSGSSSSTTNNFDFIIPNPFFSANRVQLELKGDDVVINSVSYEVDK